MKVAVTKSTTNTYPKKPPFHPPEIFPEISFISQNPTDPSNGVYSAVRDTLRTFGLDRENYGSSRWNPLQNYISPNDNIVIKPNFVFHEFGNYLESECLTTHGSVIRAIIDYAYLAGGPNSSITIADAPIQGANFELILTQSGVDEIVEYYLKNFQYQIHVQDLRQIQAVIDNESSLITTTRQLDGDPKGYTVFNMLQDSRLSELDTTRTKYVVGDYNNSVTNIRHNSNSHQYVLSNTILEADTLINLPKLKTHNKVGVTVCLKNLIGIIGSKDCLPHHRHGKENKSADEFPRDYPTEWLISQRAYSFFQGKLPTPIWRSLRFFAKFFFNAGTSNKMTIEDNKRPFFPSGSWHGNDTIWRTVDDLNRILFYYSTDKKRLITKSERKYFALVDGIIAMEGNGPLRGIPKPCGLILAGMDPVAVDIVAASIMGFDWKKIRMLVGIVQSNYTNLSVSESELQLASESIHFQNFEQFKESNERFIPPSGWKDYIEL